MSYQITLDGVLAGEAAIAVGDAGTWQGHRAVVVKSRAATAGAVDLVKHVVDEATTWVDLDSGRPLQLETYVELGGKPNTATATFTDHRDGTYITQHDTASRTRTRVSTSAASCSTRTPRWRRSAAGAPRRARHAACSSSAASGCGASR